ncbi:MAG TPA: hypothetical protein VF582_05835 [Allosphingosinicella sp.]|jgi:hypothetical protein
MVDLPEPPTSADADLRDFQFMPLDVVRFAQSDLVALEEPAAVVAAILLWCASWHNVPAGSLTDDDRSLARLAGYGRAVPAFLKIKPGALRGWHKCSDGRLYHPVVAEKVEHSWTGKLRQRHRTYGAAIRKHNERHSQDQRETPSFEQWLEAGRPSNVTRDNKEVTRDGGVTKANVTPVSRPKSLQGRVKGEGEGEGDSTTPKPPEDAPDLVSLTQRITQAAGVSIIKPTAIARQVDIVKRWTEAAISIDDTILPTIAKRLADMPSGDTVGSLAFFDAAILKAHALNGAASKRGSLAAPPPPLAETDQPDHRIEQLRSDLRGRVGAGTYESWLAPGRTALSIDGTGLIVKSRKGFAENWIRGNFEDALIAQARAIGLESVRIIGI